LQHLKRSTSESKMLDRRTRADLPRRHARPGQMHKSKLLTRLVPISTAPEAQRRLAPRFSAGKMARIVVQPRRGPPRWRICHQVELHTIALPPATFRFSQREAARQGFHPRSGASWFPDSDHPARSILLVADHYPLRVHNDPMSLECLKSSMEIVRYLSEIMSSTTPTPPFCFLAAKISCASFRRVVK